MTPWNSFKINKLSRSALSEIQRLLASHPACSLIKTPYTDFSFEAASGKERLIIRYYPKKQSLLINGKAGELGDEIYRILRQAAGPGFPLPPNPRTLNPEAAAHANGLEHLAVSYPYAGSDESGKGDFFGPLVVAAVCLVQSDEAWLKSLGVADSKTLSLVRIHSLAADIKQALPPERISIRVILPLEYNAFLEKTDPKRFNVRHVLDQAHTGCLAVAGRAGRAVLAVVDQFSSKSEIALAGVELRQEHRAERYLAVAAASILAREACLDWFDDHQAKTGLALPRGASDPKIMMIARRIKEQEGLAGLRQVAKMNFKPLRELRLTD